MEKGTAGRMGPKTTDAGDGVGGAAAVVLAPRARPELAVVVDAWCPVLPWSAAGAFHAVTYTLAAPGATRAPGDGSGSTADGAGSPPTWVTLPERWRTAAPARVASFVAGRYCAREALARALAAVFERAGGPSDPTSGTPAPVPVPVADRTLSSLASGAPSWPEGFVGSITHTPDRALAVAASDRQLRAIGIDCERIMDAATADDIVDHIVPELDTLLAGAGLADSLSRATVISLAFSAKESLYKALHPLVHEFFDFTDVCAERLDMTSSTLELRLLRPLGSGGGSDPGAAVFDVGTSFTARFALSPGEIVTLVELPIVHTGHDGARPVGPDLPNQNAGFPHRTTIPRRHHAVR